MYEKSIYYARFFTPYRSVSDLLINNAENLRDAMRHEEALQCYEAALSNPELPLCKRWSVLISCSDTFVKLYHYNEALTKLNEAMENLRVNNLLSQHGMLVQMKIEDVEETMKNPRNTPSS